MRWLNPVIPPVLVLVIVILAWQGCVVLFDLEPLIVPGPGRVFSAAQSTAQQLAESTWLTAQAAGCGLGLSVTIGTLVAFAFSQSKFLRRGCYPYAIFLQTVPIVAVAPLVIVMFGRGFHSVVIVSFIVSVFPIITNGTTGLLATDPNLVDLFRLHRASWIHTLFKLRLPSAVPYLLAGIRVSAGIAVIGAIVGEFFVGYSSGHGLGYLIRMKSDNLKTDELFAAVIASTLLGVAVFAVINIVGAFILRRWYDQEN